MRVILNGSDIAVGSAEVDVSAGKICRQFTLRVTENKQSIFIGDRVEIYSVAGLLLISAQVEYVEVSEKSEFTYAGRNDAKYIVDCDSTETIQFSEGQGAKEVFQEVASRFGLSVNGFAEMPKNTIKKILIGDRFGAAFVEIAKSCGKIITSDANGSISIQQIGEKGPISFAYGVNLRNRRYKRDSTQEHDLYTVVSQSNYLLERSQDVDVQGSYGRGVFTKVLLSQDNLTEQECERLAKIEWERDQRRAMVYSVEVDAELSLEVGKIYDVEDPAINLDEALRLKRMVLTMAQNKDVQRLDFERNFQ